MRALSRRTLIVATTMAAAVAAGFAVAVIVSKPPNIICPSISRSTAINAMVDSYKGGRASARLMTLRDFEAGNPSVGQGALPPDDVLWVVVATPAAGQRFPGSEIAWTLSAIDATTGTTRIQERGTDGWPSFFNTLPDRAWFCPG